MIRYLWTAFFAVVAGGDTWADTTQSLGLMPTSTYSIVGRDPKSGHLGVAVQSHYFAVGSEVAFAAAGVAAIATQAWVEPRYGVGGAAVDAFGNVGARRAQRLAARR